jgi:sugar phosphate isomerase/epimerase
MLATNGLTLFAIGGYMNPLREDPASLRDAIALAPQLGTTVVHTWSGTANEDIFEDDPANVTDTAFDQAVTFFREVAVWAEEAGVIVALEPFHHHVARSPERLRALLDAVDSPYLAAAMDPPNFLPVDIAASVNERMPDMFATLGGRLAIAHAKDLRIPLEGETEGVLGGVVLPGPGEGIMDYDLYVKLLMAADVETIIVEHISPATQQAAHAVVARSIANNKTP